VKVTNGAIYEAKEPLAGLLKERLPVKTSYWLTKMARQIGQHYSDIHETRMKLFAEYGDETRPGYFEVKAGSPRMAEFLAAQAELMAVEVELAQDKVKIVATDDLKVSAETLLALEDFVEIEGV
jgi:hypothetical protein